MPGDPPADVAELARHYDRTHRGPAAATQRWWNWAVFRDDAAGPRAIGTVECSLDGKTASLAYLFGPATWGMGYATEACAAALGYLLAFVPDARVEASIDTRNARSIALVERLGFRCVETLVDADRFKGSASDEYRFALAPSEDAVPKIHVGETAPDFSAATETGTTVTRASALASGPAVLIFYPMDDTPGCTAQLCAVRDDTSRYAEAGIAVYGVNGGSAASHAKFVAKHNLTAPLLVDAGNTIATAYDATIGVGPLKVVNRTVVGIARDGRVAFYERGSPATDAILAALR